jgi:hypothetical protein
VTRVSERRLGGAGRAFFVSLLLRARSLVIYFIIFDPIGGALNIIEAKKKHISETMTIDVAHCVV